jgi:hypothetical protein
MTRDCCDLWDVSTDFEQPGNTIVTKIMQMQVDDPQELARAREISSNGVAAKRKDFIAPLRHCENDLERFLRKIAPYVIPDLLAGVLHISDQNTASFLIEILP